MYRNIAFLSTDRESSQLLRAELFRLGLEFTGVQVNNKFHFMLVTNNLKLIKTLVKTYNCGKFFLSDSRRTLFEVSFIGGKFSPINLGTLKRSLSQESSSCLTSAGTFCLIVNEDNQNYYYEVQQNVEVSPQL